MMDSINTLVDEVRNIRQLLQNRMPGSDVNKDIRADLGRQRALTPGHYTVVETTDNYDDSALNADGSLSVAPGDEVELAVYRAGNNGGLCLAVGANDANDVQYYMRVDSQHTVGGVTNSPLGLVTSPFSFVETLDGAVPFNSRVSYIARVDSDAASARDLAARMHVTKGSDRL